MSRLTPSVLVLSSVALVMGICSLTGCASAVHVSSDPIGAQISVNGQPAGVTPTYVAVSLGGPSTLIVTKEGYQPAQQMVGPGMSNQVYLVLKPEAVDKTPPSFVRTMEPGWVSVEIRDGVKPEDAWNSALDLLARKFDMEVLSKDNGYMRTVWLNSWTGQLREDYRVRVTVKFSPDYKKVDIKSEANYQSGAGWVMGSDSALLQTLKTDLMGTVGRVTR